MADPTTEAPAWLLWLLGTGGTAAMAYQGYLFVATKLKASTEEARAERKAARAEAAETDSIKHLVDQISRMQEEINRLTKRVGDQETKIEELTERLTEAINDRLKAIEEASRVRGDHVQMETRLTQEITDHSALTRSHADLCAWVRALSLSDTDRAAPTYIKAMSWLAHHQLRINDAA